ncbi:uncharacterized protein si:ch73-345f18.3 isoform X1 [Callorhinchus milii]|uniref:uncharacterized protein si:ch73-345f18.3 isoform X1 n=1 Tax=Callorhinchus milii TaxID=7868 RepID=UPI00045738CB|nr:uncharacterized protein si:ch73-345f18.3 isoform X1 [Callorhinchus milii]|eukprot:gi/632937882/ref/XP_007901415.1/ PREDICTED: uncharacterized protein LOC103184955 isoform X1 [Callorhinchus milii]
MSLFPVYCCCCCRRRPLDDDDGGERERLRAPQSVRQLQCATDAVSMKDGRITAKVVNVADLDRCFADIVNTFNDQQVNYLTLCESTRLLKEHCQCISSDMLIDCIKTLQQEHSGFAVNVEMKGYNFSLSVESTQSIPKQLQQVQQCVKELCASTKSIIAADPKLQEMINSMVQSEEENLERVKLASNTYQDQTRCLSNMRMNFKEIKRAKELSNTYREAAYSVLRDMAQVAGINV